MGIEYQLRLTAPDRRSIEFVLRRLPFAVRDSSIPGQIEIRTDANSEWPDAAVSIKVGEVYFCDNCTYSSGTVLGAVVARLTATFGAITIEEL
jgi:hypothetical protein